MQTTFKQISITYFFNHSKMGFSNSVTVNAISIEDAMQKAQKEVAMCYGSSMLKKFTFKKPEKF